MSFRNPDLFFGQHSKSTTLMVMRKKKVIAQYNFLRNTKAKTEQQKIVYAKCNRWPSY